MLAKLVILGLAASVSAKRYANTTTTAEVTVYTTVCPATTIYVEAGTTKTKTYITTSTVTTTKKHASYPTAYYPTAYYPTAPVVIHPTPPVTLATTIYTTICPATTTYVESGTSKTKTYITTSTVTTLVPTYSHSTNVIVIKPTEPVPTTIYDTIVLPVETTVKPVAHPSTFVVVVPVPTSIIAVPSTSSEEPISATSYFSSPPIIATITSATTTSAPTTSAPIAFFTGAAVKPAIGGLVGAAAIAAALL